MLYKIILSNFLAIYIPSSFADHFLGILQYIPQLYKIKWVKTLITIAVSSPTLLYLHFWFLHPEQKIFFQNLKNAS